MQDNLLTPEEFAERLSVSSKSVRRWLRTGKLNGVKVGRLWRIRESDLKDYVTPDEAAARLSISPKTIRDWLRSGRIKGEKVGGRWRLRESELRDFISGLHKGESNSDTRTR